MQWEIVLVVVLIIGICAAVIEARQKRSAFKKDAGTMAPEKDAYEDSFRKNNK